MKNNLTSLNNYLFEELERLNDDEALEDDNQLEKELKRAEAITEVAEKIISNGSLMLKAIHEQNEYGSISQNVPKILIGTDKDA